MLALAAVLILLGTAVFGAPAIADETSGDPAGTASTTLAEPILGGGPNIGAKSAIVMEVGSGAVLYAKNAADSREPMSLTKLMTALLAL